MTILQGILDPGGSARDRGGGRARGYRHSDATRLKISRAKCKAMATQLRTRPLATFASRVSAAAFGGHDVDKSDSLKRRNEHFHEELGALFADNRGSHHRHIARAVASHVEAQSAGISEWLQSSSCIGLISQSTMDGASMWVRKPPGKPCLAGTGSSRLKQRGRNTNVEVMNRSETLVSVRGPKVGEANMQGLSVMSPGTVLPAMNWATELDRWKTWSVVNARAPGRAVDPQRLIAATAVPQQLLLFCKDAAVTNTLVEGSTQRAAILSQGGPKETTVYGAVCIAHQTVLSMKPPIQRLGDVCSNMVRGGNLFLSGRLHGAYQATLDAFAQDVEFVDVHRLPRMAHQWRATMQQIFEMARPSRDMTLQDEEFVMMFLNSDPASSTLKHFHLPQCPCGGRGHRVENSKRCLRLTFGAGPRQCLLYRWKFQGFEQAVCYFFKGTALWDNIVHRVLFHCYRDVDFARAQQELNDAAHQGQQDFAAANKVRAGKLLKFLEREPAEKWILTAVCATKPHQRVLNTVFEAEKNMRAFTAAVCSETLSQPSSLEDGSDFFGLRDKALQSNVKILSGKVAELSLIDITAYLLEFDGPMWSDALPRERKFKAAMLLCCSYGSLWYRVMWRQQIQTKAQILVACSGPYNQVQLEENLLKIVDKHSCELCCDMAFSKPWIDKLIDLDTQRDAHSLLNSAAAVFPATTLVDERKHMLGQETHHTRKRGRAPSARQLQLKTYRKIVRQHMLGMSKAVEDDVLKSKGIKRKQFIDYVARLQGNSVDRRRRRAIRLRTRTSYKVSGFSLFKFAEWRHGLSPFRPEGKAETRRIAKLWRSMSRAQRAPYESDAAKRTAEASDTARATSRQTAQTIRRGRMAKMFDDIRQHRLWSTGAQLMTYGCGLASAKVDVDSTDQEVATKLRSFDFDQRVAPNPPSFPAEKVCAEKYGGLCGANVECSLIVDTVEHLFNEMRKNDAKELPLFIRLSTEAGQQLESLAVFCYGKGDFMATLLTDHLAANSYRLRYTQAADGRLRVDVASMHILLLGLFEDARRVNGVGLDELTVSASAIQDLGRTEFAFSLAGLLFESTIQTKRKIKRVAEPEWAPFGLDLASKNIVAGDDDLSDRGSVDPDDHEKLLACDHADKLSDFSTEGDDNSHDEGEDEDVEAEPQAQPAEPVETGHGHGVHVDGGGVGGHGAVVKRVEGLQAYGPAPSSRAKCMCCRDPIMEDTLRLEYFHKNFLRFVHGECAAHLPPGTRGRDYHLAMTWAADPSLTVLARTFVDNVIDQLMMPPSAGASASGAPASSA